MDNLHLQLPEELPDNLDELQGILEKILDNVIKNEPTPGDKRFLPVMYACAAKKYNMIAGRSVMFENLRSAVASHRYHQEKNES